MSGSEWRSGEYCIPSDSWGIERVMVMNPEGVGEAIILTIVDQENESEEYSFILSLETAGNLGYDLIGLSTGWAFMTKEGDE